jgi:hypothetical protein
VRRASVLALVGAAIVGTSLVACGATTTAHTPTPIAFGVTGGNVVGYRVSIQSNGSVRSTGSARAIPRQIAAARLRQLRDEIEHAHLMSRSCPGALPDLARQYIRVGRRTITVHGDCEPAFQRVWNDLGRAVGASRS